MKERLIIDKHIYQDPYEVQAIMFGYLVRAYGKVSPSHMNKLLAEVGLDKVNKYILNELVVKFEEEEHLYTLLHKAIDGELNLDNVKHYYADTSTTDKGDLPFVGQNIHQLLSPTIVEQQKILQNSREFNKVQRNGAYFKLLFDELKQDFAYNFDLTYTDTPRKVIDDKGDKALVVTLADLHIGATVSEATGHGYNLDIFDRRMAEYLTEVLYLTDKLDPDYVVILGIGDYVESTVMRNNQSYDTEIDLSAQINKATEFIYKFTKAVADVKPVKFGMVNGNHDRLTQDKKADIYNQSVATIVLGMLQLLQDSGNLANVELYDNIDNTYAVEMEVANKKLYVTHGDKGIAKSKPIANLGKDIDILITGHYHSFKTIQEDNDRLHVAVGTPMGSNSYANSNNFGNSQPSQTIMYLDSSMKGAIIYPVFFD